MREWKTKGSRKKRLPFLSGYSDSNGGPSAPKADTLTNCATPRILPQTTKCFPMEEAAKV